MKKVVAIILLCFIFSIALCSCVEKNDTQDVITIYMPDGAPALSMASFLQKDKNDDLIEYNVVNASTITAFVTGENPKADVCILPLNAAAKLLGSGDNYKMLGVVTHGNLFMLSLDDSKTFNKKDDLENLKGKKVGVIQIANVPGLTFKTILKNASIPYVENEGDFTKDNVFLYAISDPATGVSPAGGCDYYVAAEPLISAKIKGTQSAPKPFKLVGNLQTLYGENGYPQAVVVCKNDLIKKNKKWVDNFIKELNNIDEYYKDTDIKTIVDSVSSHLEKGQAPTFSEKNLTKEVLSNCGIYYKSAVDAKGEVEEYIQKIIEINPQSAKVVSNDFYYGFSE